MAELNQEAFSNILILAYEAAERPERWTAFLSGLLLATQAQNAALRIHDLHRGNAVGSVVGIEPDQQTQYFEHYSKQNPWVPQSHTAPIDRPICRGEAVISKSSLMRTEFYTDWGGRNDVVFTIAAHLQIREGQLLYLTLNQGDRQGTHTQATERLLGLLSPHLQVALRHQQEFQKSALLQRTLDDLSLPLFILDGSQKIIEMTSRAQKLLAAGTHFISERGTLRAIVVDVQHRITRQLSLLSKTSYPRSRAVRLASTTGSKGSIAVLTRDTVRRGDGELRFVLSVIDSASSPRAALESAARVYDITPGETRLIAALLAEGSLDRAIDRVGITRNTARTQMASIFVKTGTRRQGEVIQMFSRFTHVTHLGDDPEEGGPLQSGSSGIRR